MRAEGHRVVVVVVVDLETETGETQATFPDMACARTRTWSGEPARTAG